MYTKLCPPFFFTIAIATIRYQNKPFFFSFSKIVCAVPSPRITNVQFLYTGPHSA